MSPPQSVAVRARLARDDRRGTGGFVNLLGLLVSSDCVTGLEIGDLGGAGVLIEVESVAGRSCAVIILGGYIPESAKLFAKTTPSLTSDSGFLSIAPTLGFSRAFLDGESLGEDSRELELLLIAVYGLVVGDRCFLNERPTVRLLSMENFSQRF